MTRSVVAIAAALARDPKSKTTTKPATLALAPEPAAPAPAPASVPLWTDGAAGADDRNYGAEVRAVVDQYNDGVQSAAAIADAVVTHLRAENPALLAAFLNLHAHQIIRGIVTSVDRSRRAYNRANAVRSVFSDAADEFENGNETPLRSQFLDESYTLADGGRRKLRDLTADDLTFVADSYYAMAKDLGMRGAFLRAVARRCGGQPVGEVFTEEELARMWASLGA